MREEKLSNPIPGIGFGIKNGRSKPLPYGCGGERGGHPQGASLRVQTDKLKFVGELPTGEYLPLEGATR